MKKLAVLLLLVLLLAGCAPAPVNNAAPAKVFFAGENNGVKTTLDLAAQAGTVALVTDIAQADALVLDGVIPPGAAERARAGAGVMKISPLHNCFPITMRPAALSEAQALTEARVKLVTGK
jgi:hypothetical protein